MTRTGDLYGQSLYDLAAEDNLTDEILGEMKQVGDLFAENPDYVTLLLEPSLPRQERLSLLDTAFGGEVQEYLLNFLKLLTERGLLREYKACYTRYRACYNRDHNIADAVVTSAVPLTDEQRTRLSEKLEAMSGKTVLLTEKTDPSVLGGLRVELDGTQLDGTVQGRLSELRRRVDETVM